MNVDAAADLVDRSADRLFAAARDRQLVDLLSTSVPTLDVTQGYAIQDALLARHVAAGAVISGAKLGLTSVAKQVEMQVHEPIGGWLTDRMAIASGEALMVSSLVQPRCEPEIAFLLGSDLAGPTVTATDVMAATASLMVAIEVLDSRYRDYRFTLPDVIADDASAARYLVGAAVAAGERGSRRLWRHVPHQRHAHGQRHGCRGHGRPGRSGRLVGPPPGGVRTRSAGWHGGPLRRAHGGPQGRCGRCGHSAHRRPGHARAPLPMIGVGIIGFGFVGAELYRRLAAGGHGLTPAFVHVRDPRAARAAGVPESQLLADLGAVGSREVDVIIEAAHPDITRLHGERLLGSADYLPLSITALVDDDLRGRLTAVGAAAGNRLLLPHSALVGAASLAEWRDQWRSVTFRMEKPPGSIDLAARQASEQRTSRPGRCSTRARCAR